jgi:hypothetical protein
LSVATWILAMLLGGAVAVANPLRVANAGD